MSEQGRSPRRYGDPRDSSPDQFDDVRHMSEPGSHDKFPLNENRTWSREAEGHHRRAMADARWPSSPQDEWSPTAYTGTGWDTMPIRSMPRYKEFIGKGPKGYSRADALIQEDVSQRLSHGYLDASEIEVSVKNGEVTLTGTVNSKHDRRLAEDLVEDCFGVKEVDNRLKVPRSRTSLTDEYKTAGKDSREDSAPSASSTPSGSGSGSGTYRRLHA